MIKVENQERYKEAPLTITMRNAVNPMDVITGLINKGTEIANTGRTAVEALSGETVNTNIDGYDVNITKDGREEPKRIWGIPKPIFITGAITLGAIVIFAAVTMLKKKQTS